jgi:hypothetical protein
MEPAFEVGGGNRRPGSMPERTCRGLRLIFGGCQPRCGPGVELRRLRPGGPQQGHDILEELPAQVPLHPLARQ